MKIRNDFLFSGIAMLMTSCGVQRENDSNNRDIPVVVSPTLGVTATAPAKNDVLYSLSKTEEYQKSSSLRSLFSSSTSSSKTLYRASGSGGLGEDLSDTDKLDAYDGIPINITKNSVEPTIKVEASGDNICPFLFTYTNNKIEVLADKVNTLTVCTIKISATGVIDGKVVNDSASFVVNLNPTMKNYAEANNITFQYLQKYSSLSDIKLISKWIKDANQSALLDLKYDAVKALGMQRKVEDINALTGAQNVINLDLSNTDLKDLRAVSLLNNVESLDISGTRVEPKDLKILSNLSKLKKLSVRNLEIKDVSIITENLTNLVELDISGNSKINNLKNLKKMKNLRILRASNIGLTDLADLNELTQITSLDLSDNDLSKLTEKESQLLANIFNLEELNLSNSKANEIFIDKYFGLISNRNSLKKLIIRNSSNRNIVGGCDKITKIYKLTNLTKLQSLKYVDFHGNLCTDANGFYEDVIRVTSQFSAMPSLEYLDISNTDVYDLSSLVGLQNLKRLKLYDDDGGIAMTKNQCLVSLSGARSPGINADCNLLRNGRETQAEFNNSGAYEWEVPRNVTEVQITGCSGANGGAGGGGGGEAGAFFNGNWAGSSFGGNGGSSGYLNGQSPIGGESGGAGRRCFTMGGDGGYTVNCDSLDRSHFDAWQHGSNGGNGGLGEITKFGEKSFGSANEFNGRDPSQFCLGGISGTGGAGGSNLGDAVFGEPTYGGFGGRGGSPYSTLAWSTKIETYKVSVTPGQKIKIVVGAGGAGGAGGSAGIRQNGPYYKGSRAQNGSSGSAGQNGKLLIKWEQY